MNTRALQCFIKVYEKKSITSASKDLYISPQGLSKVIKQLEIELDTELFFRGSQGMEATESGELLYARARHICYLIEDIQKEISIINGESQALNVIISASVLFAIPLDTIYNFCDDNPKCHINIQDYPDNYPIGELFEEKADVGILIGHQGIDNCSYDLVYRGETILIVSKSHPLADKDEVSIMDLENEILAIKTVEADKDHPIVGKCIEMGITPIIKHASPNIAGVHHLCLNQNVIGVSIDFIENYINLPDLKILRLKESVPMNIFCVSKNRERENKAITALKTYLKKQGNIGS